MRYPIPPFDPELAASLSSLDSSPVVGITGDDIAALRAGAGLGRSVLDLERAQAARHDYVIDGFRDGKIDVTVIRPARVATGAPAIFFLHGGGMIAGTRFDGIDRFLPFVASHGVVLISVEYRYAPEFPDPYPVEDAFSGLSWAFSNATSLGIDPRRVLLAGVSAGGGLAAGVSLLARDRHLSSLAGQLLIYPMLDDRNESVSSRQIDGVGIWDRASNITGWTALLGARRGSSDVSPYAAPARADDLSDVPATYIDVGSTDVFRDECVQFASRLWEHGISAELHVWPGAFHAFEEVAPLASVSRAAQSARRRWIEVTLALA